MKKVRERGREKDELKNKESPSLGQGQHLPFT